ncbi:hypothetical protein FRB96_005794 [Tulasnella sp. 330]|nr:hypothetical protein FRB96_005794 [Tulasnella sp. 330]
MPIFGRRKDTQAKQSQAINEIIADLDGWVIEKETIAPLQSRVNPNTTSSDSCHQTIPRTSPLPSNQAPPMPPIPQIPPSPPLPEAVKKQPSLKSKKSGLFRYFGRSESSSSMSSMTSLATDPNVLSTPETSPNYANTTFNARQAPRRLSSKDLRGEQEGFTVGRKPKRPSTSNASSPPPPVSFNASQTSLEAENSQGSPAAPTIDTQQRQRSRNYESNPSLPAQQRVLRSQESMRPARQDDRGIISHPNDRSRSFQPPPPPDWNVQPTSHPLLTKLQIPHSPAPSQPKRQEKIVLVAEQLAATSDDEQDLQTVVAPQSRQREQALHGHRGPHPGEDRSLERMTATVEAGQRSGPREAVRERTGGGDGSPPLQVDRQAPHSAVTRNRAVEKFLSPEISQALRQRSFEWREPPHETTTTTTKESGFGTRGPSRVIDTLLEQAPSPFPPRVSPMPPREEPVPIRESLLAPPAPQLAPPRKPVAEMEQPSWYVAGPSTNTSNNPLDLYSSLFNTTLRDETVPKGRRKAGPVRPSTGGGAPRNTAPIGRKRSESGVGMDLAGVEIGARGVVASGLAPTQPLSLRKRDAAPAALRNPNAEAQQQTFQRSLQQPIRRPSTASTVPTTMPIGQTFSSIAVRVEEEEEEARVDRIMVSRYDDGGIPPYGGNKESGSNRPLVERHTAMPPSGGDPPRRQVKPSRSLTDIKTASDADFRAKAKTDAIWGGGIDPSVRVAAGMEGIGMRRFAPDPSLSLRVN